MHKATGQHQSHIENYKKFVEEERKKENQDQAQIFLLNSHLNLVTTWKMDIINGGYGTTTQLQHQGLVDLENSIFDYQKQEKGMCTLSTSMMMTQKEKGLSS